MGDVWTEESVVLCEFDDASHWSTEEDEPDVDPWVVWACIKGKVPEELGSFNDEDDAWEMAERWAEEMGLPAEMREP